MAVVVRSWTVRSIFAATILLAVVFDIVFAWAASAGADTLPIGAGPIPANRLEAIRYGTLHPDTAPPGANDDDCRPTAAHPNPIILAHGSDSTAYADWSFLAPALRADGYCVFALNYGAVPGKKRFGYDDIAVSAGQLKSVVEHVLCVTGAAKVDLVGYSQGATVTRYYVNRLGGAEVVDKWVGLASPTYGGVFYGLAPILRNLPGGDSLIDQLGSVALDQQIEGSTFLNALNSGGDTVPGVRYTTILTRNDESIQPYTNGFLRDPRATNIVVQDLCPADQTGHFNLVADALTLRLIRNVLDPVNAMSLPCEPVPLGAGIVDVIIGSNS